MLFHAKFNVYRYLSILVNFLDMAQSHGVYVKFDCFLSAFKICLLYLSRC
jgi:hypothetical protein